MKKFLMIAVFAVAVSSIALSGCMVTNAQKGAVIGGATGGILGNQFGKGTGKTVATGVGVLLGTMTGAAVGESMDRPVTVVPNGNVVPHSMSHSHSNYERQCLHVPHRYVDGHGHYHDYSRMECRMIKVGPHFH